MTKISKQFYEFGRFRLDVTEQQLWRDGEEISLTPKAYGVLLMLVRNGGHALTKEDFLREVWPDTVVEEKNLTDNISILRQVLGDSIHEQRFIKTVPRRGYRFVADVREINDGDLVMHETSQSRIVIEEEVEPANVNQVARVPFQVQPLPGLLEGKRSRPRWLLPLLISACIVLVGGVALAVSRVWNHPTASTVAAPRTIAVLPFKPLVAENGDQSLELGMTDALITKLSNIRQITVRPTSSVLKYNAGQDLRVAGKELGVDVVLDGKVQKSGDRIRLSVQLVRASDGVPIWAEQFDEEFKDIFTVQDSVSERVAAALALRLTGEEKKGLAKRYTDNAEAYQLYLKGLYHWQTFSRDGLLKSLNFYNAAIERDPKYALAYAGLANTYNVITIYGPLSVSESMEKSRAAALRAVELDETLAEAHVALGAVKIMHEWDWPGAERELKRAIALDPKAAGGHNLYGYYLQAMGKQNEAVEEMKKATEVAPQWFIVMQDHLEATFGARRYDEAIALSLEALRLEPDDPFALWVLGRCYMMTGRHDEAVPLFERGLKVVESEGPESATRIWLLSGLGYAHARAGRRVEAQKVVVRMRESESRWKNLYVAMVLAGLGERDQAFAMLDEAYRERAPFLWQVRFLPEYDALRLDPRYAALLARLKLQA